MRQRPGRARWAAASTLQQHQRGGCTIPGWAGAGAAASHRFWSTRRLAAGFLLVRYTLLHSCTFMGQQYICVLHTYVHNVHVCKNTHETHSHTHSHVHTHTHTLTPSLSLSFCLSFCHSFSPFFCVSLFLSLFLSLSLFLFPQLLWLPDITAVWQSTGVCLWLQRVSAAHCPTHVAPPALLWQPQHGPCACDPVC